MTEFFIPGPLPGMNEIVAARSSFGNRRKWNGYAVMKKSWERTIVAQILIQKVKEYRQPVAINFKWIEKDRKRDADNIRAGAKFILDALVGAGIIPDDSRKWVVALSDTYEIQKNNPGVWVTIIPKEA